MARGLSAGTRVTARGREGEADYRDNDIYRACRGFFGRGLVVNSALLRLSFISHYSSGENNFVPEEAPPFHRSPSRRGNYLQTDSRAHIVYARGCSFSTRRASDPRESGLRQRSSCRARTYTRGPGLEIGGCVCAPRRSGPRIGCAIMR